MSYEMMFEFWKYVSASNAKVYVCVCMYNIKCQVFKNRSLR